MWDLMLRMLIAWDARIMKKSTYDASWMTIEKDIYYAFKNNELHEHAILSMQVWAY